MLRLVLALFIISSPLIINPPAHSQAGFQVLQPHVAYHFGDQVVFQALLQSNPPAHSVYISYQSLGLSVQTHKIDVGVDGTTTYTLNLKESVLRPFATVTYWYSIDLGSGSVIDSPKFSFTYEDNRFTWQTLDQGLFHIHWVEGDLSFGQEAENAAEKGLASIQKLLSLNTPVNPFEIYVYAHAKDLQDSLEMGGENWVAGHASPDLGVVLVSIPIGPEQQIQMEQQIPHELAHVMLYQKAGAKYVNLPMWLNEGLASMVELYPNADYSRTLDSSRQSGSLLSMDSICQTFPSDASGAFQAYAQSASFTQYLQRNYGSSGIDRLIQGYIDGLGCSEGTTAAFGASLISLDIRWQQAVLGVNVEVAAWQKLLPYLTLFGLLLVFTVVPGVFTYQVKKENVVE